MKKRMKALSLLLVLALSVSAMLTGCGGGNPPATVPANAPSAAVATGEPTTPASEPTTAPAPSEPATPADPHVSRDGVNYYERYGIKDNGDSITIVDSLKVEVTVPKNPKRVANLYNSYLSIWKLLGGDVAAIVEQSPDKPVAGIESATLVGTPGSPNVEKIIELEPDFVIIAPFSKNKEIAETLNAMGIPTIYSEVKSKDDYYRMVRFFSALLGNEEGFERYALDVEESIQALLSKVPSGEPQRILLMMSTQSGVTVKNNNSLNGEMLRDLGVVNIADNAVTGDKSEQFSLEQIVAEDPDIIFMTEMGSNLEAIAKKRNEMLESDPVWGELSAVKNGRYHILPKSLFTYKPNEDYLEAYTILAKYIYPEVFE